MNTAERPPTIYTDPSQSEKTVTILEGIQTLEEKLENMPEVSTEEQASLVSEYRAQLKKRATELNKERLEMTAGARQTVTMMNQKYNVHIERAERASKLADNLLLPYMREQRRIREEAEEAERKARQEEQLARQKEQEALAEAQRIADETKDAAALKEAEEKVRSTRDEVNALSSRPVRAAPPKSTKGIAGSTTGLRKVWKYKVVDISKVPESFLVDPEDRIKKGELNAIAKRDQETAHVPGIEFYYEDSLSSTVSGTV